MSDDKEKKWEDENVPVPLELHLKKRRKKGKGKNKKDRILTVAEMEKEVADICLGRVIVTETEKKGNNRVAHYALQVYLEKLAVFYDKREKNWKKTIERNPGILGCCSRAVAQAEMIKAKIEDYIVAQFWFYRKFFGRAPTYPEIAGPKAILHYKQWRVALSKGEVDKVIVTSTIGGTFDPRKTPDEIVLKYEMNVLKRMIYQWGSEEKVWQLFGRLNDEDVFSDDFKRTRPIWIGLYANSEREELK